MSAFAPSPYYNNPDEKLAITLDHLDSNATSEALAARDNQLKDIARRLVWTDRSVEDQDVTIAVLQGGLTNNLFLLTAPGAHSKVIVRLFGEGKHKFAMTITMTMK